MKELKLSSVNISLDVKLFMLKNLVIITYEASKWDIWIYCLNKRRTKNETWS